MITHSEPTAIEPELSADVANGARTYLTFGPAPINELVRVLSQHLAVVHSQVLVAEVMALVAEGELNYSASGMVSLPAGGSTRESKEQR